MSSNSLILVTFPCHEYAAIADLAAKHCSLLGVELTADRKLMAEYVCMLERGVWEAVCFLAAAAARNSGTNGQNGDVYSWGIVGNYTDAKVFVNTLKPFFLELLGVPEDLDGGPLDFHHVLVFSEHEETLRAKVFDIFRPLNSDGLHEMRLQVDIKTLPVCWEI